MTKHNELPDRPVLFIDMDGVIADFNKSHHFIGGRKKERHPHEMYKEGFFETLPVIAGARYALRALLDCNKYEIYILSKPVRHSPLSYSEKAAWIWKHFPELGEKITLTQNKTLLSGKDRILIDDTLVEWGEPWQEAGGQFIHFDYRRNHEEEWRRILEQLL